MTRRTGFSPEVRACVLSRALGRCEIQWSCDGDPAVHLHHRRPRGLGGSRRASTNLACNSLAACLDCHAFVESHRALALECGWLISQAEDDPETVPVLVRRRWCLLEPDGTVVEIPDRTTVTTTKPNGENL